MILIYKRFDSLHRRSKILERRVRLKDCSTVIVASSFVPHFYFFPFFAPCKLLSRFWVARLTDRNENQSWRVCNVENSTNENVFRFSLPPFPRLPTRRYFSLSRNRGFSSFLFLFPSLSFVFYLGTVSSRSVASRTRSTRVCNIKKPRRR